MKKFFVSLNLTFLLVLFSIASQGQIKKIFRGSYNERAERLFDFCLKDLSGFDSVRLFSALDSVKQLARGEGDRKLVWYADLFQTVFLSYQRKPADEEQTLLLKKRYFETSPYPEIKGSFYFFMGVLYYHRRDFEKSFHYYVNADDVFETLGYPNIPLFNHYCYNFFRLYYLVGDYPSAIHFLQIQINTYRPENQKNLPFNYNNLGVTYLKLGEVQKAQVTFQKSIDWARRYGNIVYVGIASGNYGNTLRRQQRYNEALPYLYTDVALNKDTLPDNSAITYVYIANCLLHLDSISKASSYLDTALELKPDWVWSSFGGNYYETKALFYKKIGDFKSSMLYQDTLLQLRDSIKLRNDVALFKAIALKFKEKKALAERREKELEKREIRLTRNLIIAFLLILFIAVTTYLYRERKKERVSFEQRRRRDEEKLQQAEEQLDRYLDAIKEKNKMIADIEASFEKGPANTADPNPENYSSARKLSEQSLSTENDWQDFKTLFTLVHPQFFESLQSRYTDLSQGEVRLLALCKLQLSSKEMAAMLGISPQSLRTNRYRLRKKYPELIHDEEFRGYI
jgi:tetratricopeptide (TPR) repeat protein